MRTRKNTVKLLCALLTLLMVLPILPVAAYAVDEEEGVTANSSDIQWVGANVSVGADLSISYYLSVGDVDVSKLAVEFTMGGNTVLVKDYDEVDGNYVFKFSGIGPHQMTEVITAKAVLVNGDAVEEVLSTYDGYTVKDNCEELLKSEDAVLKRAVSDLLYYGAESQKYLGSAGELATDGVEGILAVDAENVPNGDDFVGYGMPIGVASANGSRLVSAGVMFDSTIKVYFKYTMGAGEFAIIKINGVDAIPMEGEGNKFTVYSAELNATQLDDELIVELSVNGAPIQTLVYSANYYAYKMQNEASMSGLALAMYRYGASAGAYANR